MQSPPIKLASRYFGSLVLCYLVFLAFASFYLPDFISPRRFARAGPGELFFLADEFRLRWWNLRDISINLLLYMPLGFLVALSLAPARLSRPGLHWGWGFLLSVGVEVVQAFIGRFSDATDVVSNGTGYVLGFAIARIAVLHFGVSPAALLGLESGGQEQHLKNVTGLRFIYLTVVLIAVLLPLDISFSLSQLAAKLHGTGYRMPRLIVDPLFHFRNGVHTQYLMLQLLVFLPLAFLSAYILLLRRRVGILQPAIHCLLLGLVTEASNLFIRSGRSDILVPVLGFLTGLGVASVMVGFARRAGPDKVGLSAAERHWLLLGAGLLYGLLLLAIALSPFEFELSLRALRYKLLNNSNFLPFRLHFTTSSLESAVDIVREPILYAPLGGLLALWLGGLTRAPSRRTILVLATVAGFGFAGGVEALQLGVVGRYVDITDALLGGIGSLGGAILSPGRSPVCRSFPSYGTNKSHHRFRERER
ncbi:MAG: VanZ family protein [Gammaproteobacteria bacterium]|nr:VanZ family protein [Pseudomonadales bacterium]